MHSINKGRKVRKISGLTNPTKIPLPTILEKEGENVPAHLLGRSNYLPS